MACSALAVLVGAAVGVPAAAGALTITAPLAADLAPITLNGAAQVSTGALAGFSVTDDTLLFGLGWNVTVEASRFREHVDGAYVPGGKTLPAGSLRMPAPTVTAFATISPGPTIQAGAPWAIDGVGAVKIASAAVGSGMGRYDFGAVTLALTVPPSAHAKAYRSDITFSAVTGP